MIIFKNHHFFLHYISKNKVCYHTFIISKLIQIPLKIDVFARARPCSSQNIVLHAGSSVVQEVEIEHFEIAESGLGARHFHRCIIEEFRAIFARGADSSTHGTLLGNELEVTRALLIL